MVCSFDREELSALLDGELSAADQARVREHLKSCSECAREYSDIESASSSVRQLRDVPAPKSILESVRNNLAPQPVVSRNVFLKHRRLLEGALALAASLLLVLSAVTLLNPDRTAPSATTAGRTPDPSVAKPADLKALESRKLATEEKELDSRPKREVAEEKKIPIGGEKAAASVPESVRPGAYDAEREKPAKKAAEQRAPAPATPPAADSQNLLKEEAQKELAKGEWKSKDEAARRMADSNKREENLGRGGAANREEKTKYGEDRARSVAPVREVAVVLYSDQLADTRDAARSELGKHVKEVRLQDAVISATLSAESAGAVLEQLSHRKDATLSRLTPESESGVDHLAKLNRDSWQQSLQQSRFAGKSASGGADRKEPEPAPSAKATQTPKEPAPAKPDAAPRPEPPPSDPADDKIGRAQAGDAGKLQEQADKDRSAEGFSLKGGHDGKSSAKPSEQVLLRIYVFPRSYEGMVEELMKRAAPAEK
jgi:hypothetical protein